MNNYGRNNGNGSGRYNSRGNGNRDSDKQKNPMFGLWLKESDKGVKFFNGKITVNGVDYWVSIFKNGYKKEDRQPDYNLSLTEVKEQGSGGGQRGGGGRSREQQRDRDEDRPQREDRQRYDQRAEDEEDVPF